VAKHGVPHLIARGGGSIVNISSASAFGNQPKMMVYSVTKAGLNSLTRSEAIDLARYGIRANVISPGSVDTALVDEAVRLMSKETGRTPEETRSDWEAQYPTGRFTQPHEVAQLALFLCSERASNVTGTSFAVDGGLMALLPER
jgi:NAD(P)-dependent dehydrogenase (short-subunit alcohol dehydrogenase family)